LNSVLKHIVAKTYKPLLEKYLSKTRTYRYKDIQLEIPTEVFHPGFFFSTQLLLQYILELPLQEKRFLELGCGSGLIAIMAAKQNAIVTATDINPVAVDFLKKNSMANGISVDIIQSDLFTAIPQQPFDIIAINPPYYKKDPVNAKEHAWYCGENGEYFSKLFDQLGKYMHKQTAVLMVLSDSPDMEMINGFAAANRFSISCVHSKQNMLEKNFIFKIEKVS